MRFGGRDMTEQANIKGHYEKKGYFKKRLLNPCLFFFFYLAFLIAGEAQPLFRTYSVMDGLTSNTVWSVTQDQQGFMWFGTKNGISRFDGYQFKAYQFNKKKSGSLGNNFVNAILPIGNTLWVATQGGVYILDMEKEQFRFVKEMGRGTAYDILHDRKGNVWVGTRLSGVYCYSLTTGNVRHYKAGSSLGSLSSDHIRKLAQDNQGRIWIGTFGNGLDVLDPQKNVVKNYNAGNSKLPGDQILTIYKDHIGNIWTGTFSNGLSVFDMRSGTFRVYQREQGLNDNIVRAICEPVPGKIYIGTEKGLNILTTSNGTIGSSVRKQNDPFGLSDNAIYSIFPDREGGIWIGTFFGGVNYLTDKGTGFELYYTTSEPFSLSGNAVSSFLEDKPGMFWVGTEDGGLNYFNSSTKAFKQYPFEAGQQNLSYHNIHALYKDKYGKIWIGTFAGGLNIYDPSSGKVKVYRHNPSNPFSLSSNNIYVIYEDKDHEIWVGTTKGLNKYDAENDRFIRVKKLDLDNNVIYDIYEDETSTVWFATYDIGLISWNKRSDKWEQYRTGGVNSLSSDKLTCILDDHTGNLWLGTDGGGLNRFNLQSKTFEVYDEDRGLEGNVIYGLLQDDNRTLWISTNNGIYHFVPASKTLRFYSNWDNLQSRQFNYKAYYKSSSGKLYFGGIKGFNAFFPDSIKRYDPSNNIVITNFQLFNKEAVIGAEGSPLEKPLQYSKEIVLSHDQSVISFQYAALSYISPNKTLYAYKMEGFDADWNYVGTERKATYTNLSPGSYVFRVKASADKGQWGDNYTSIAVIVRPPFYRTIAAYVVYFFIVVFGFIAFRRYTIAQERKETMIRLERIKSKEEQEFYAQKIEFFTAMAHEIRTPLTLIIAPLEKLLGSASWRDAKEQKQLSVMEENSNRLLNLVNQLLDFRRIESEFYAIKKEDVELVSLIHIIYSRFSAMPYQKEVEFTMSTKVSRLIVQVDPEAFTKILSNLLSNAFKFTRTRIKVCINEPEELPDGQHVFCVSVEDDGIGIPASQIGNIFSKFFKVSSGKHQYSNLGGTGIGLTLAKLLTEKHEGALEVASTENVNTIFRIKIPYAEQEVLLPVSVSDDEPKNDNDEGKCNILVVEDDKALNEFICQGFESEGYQIFSSTNGREALQCIEDQRIDLIVSDFMMPEMDGMELCRSIKADVNFSHIPIIMLTARSNSEFEISAIETGVDSYIVKPFKWKHVSAVTRNLLDSRARMHEKFARQPFTVATSLTTNSRDSKFISKVIEIIEKRIMDSQLSVEELSRELCMSRSSLHKKLKTLSGHVPNEFIRLIRLKKAAELILANEHNVSEISYLVGFNSHSYFSKCFVRQFKISPSEFLEKHQEGALGLTNQDLGNS